MGNKQANTTDDGKAMNVIEVQPKSPGAKCGLQPFHDFIISINGNDFRTMNSQQIKEFVDGSEGKAVHLKVYNRPRDETREVILYPTQNWPGRGLLGIRVRLDSMQASSHQGSIQDLENTVVVVESPLKRQSATGSATAPPPPLPSGTVTAVIMESPIKRLSMSGVDSMQSDLKPEAITTGTTASTSAISTGEDTAAASSAATVTSGGRGVAGSRDSLGASEQRGQRPKSTVFRAARVLGRTVAMNPKPAKKALV